MNISKMLKLLGAAAVALNLGVGLVAIAEENANKAEQKSPQPTPHKVVEETTNELMKLVTSGQKALEENPDKYYSDVQLVMENVVDFTYIAKNVMGAKHWNSATSDQKKRFVKVFTTGLVETYAKGMANFADLDMSVVPPSDDIGDKKRVSVIQRIKGPEGTNRVAYTMGKHKSGEWKLINVVLDGVNLGETLRTQFAQAVSENKGDLDKTISGWQLKT